MIGLRDLQGSGRVKTYGVSLGKYLDISGGEPEETDFLGMLASKCLGVLALIIPWVFSLAFGSIGGYFGGYPESRESLGM